MTLADRAACTATDVLRRVGEKWTVLILAVLHERPYGFNELDRTVHGLSRRILTRTLRTLEADGLISRQQMSDRVEYALTGLGHSLLPLVIALGEWAVDHASEIEQARARAAPTAAARVENYSSSA
ncbi:winged helix-turn-helix transcriptional regulator [Micromonospora sp. NPDC005203]|uniref:winged helix-turn-helix transcriptional regulator n=1 Tax=Micromonospora sp. NPDC005203 TaxID=3364226 RepID=UPI00369F25C6